MAKPLSSFYPSERFAVATRRLKCDGLSKVSAQDYFEAIARKAKEAPKAA